MFHSNAQKINKKNAKSLLLKTIIFARVVWAQCMTHKNNFVQANLNAFRYLLICYQHTTYFLNKTHLSAQFFQPPTKALGLSQIPNYLFLQGKNTRKRMNWNYMYLCYASHTIAFTKLKKTRPLYIQHHSMKSSLRSYLHLIDG